jgi:aspartokinase
MRIPSEPVNFDPKQIEELNKKLSTLRHDVNNHLSLIMAAVELIRHKPQMSERMLATLAEQPPKITAIVTKFTADFEQAFGITRN